MGTRADYYLGRNPETMNWLGSSAWDGYPSGLPEVMAAKTLEEFQTAVYNRIDKDDGSTPAMGWPWPWEDSQTTDFAYTYDEGQVWVCHFGHGWVCASEWDDNKEWPNDKPVKFPDMTKYQKATMGPRSGLIVISG